MNKHALFFIAAVILQLGILLAVPAQKARIRATGRTVTLKVAPVDPYNILKGYYVVLGYDISRQSAMLDTTGMPAGQTVYTVVELQSEGIWEPVSLQTTMPRDLPENRAALRGTWDGSRIIYGLEEYTVPEQRRGDVENDLRQNRNEARVDVSVDENGNTSLVRLRIQDRVY
ncbi:MAG: GDYXXLXY domain-containing protein [Blastocatellia bacterium]